MVDYEKMSDSELSLAILKIQTRNLASNYAFYATKSQATCEVKSGYGAAVSVKSFDINNWSDMGTLIDEIWDHLMESEGDEYVSYWESVMHDYKCGKLRAAAIVYLLMMGK